MGSGGERRAMENGGEVRRATVNGGETMRRFASELVMCSTCSGFVFRKKSIDMDPDEEVFKLIKKSTAMGPDEEVVEVVKEAEKMRDLMQAVFLHGPFQEKEPAEATKEQWQVLRRRRLIMMETKRCPACSRSLLNMCPTCSRPLSEKPGHLEEDEAAGSKEEKKSSRKKIATTENEAMVANARSVKKSKRSREEGKRSSSRLKKKKKAKSEDKEGSGSEKKAKRSSEREGSGSKEAETEGSGSAGGNGKTKMVTRRMDKESIDILKNHPPVKPFTFTTDDPVLHCMLASEIAHYEVDCEFHEYLRRQSLIRGYAEYQVEVNDDEDE